MEAHNFNGLLRQVADEVKEPAVKKGGLNLDNLSEEDMVNVEGDYHVCVRALARSIGAKTHKKQTKI